MGRTWIDQAQVLWPAILAALAVSCAKRLFAKTRQRLAQVSWDRLVTIELRVTVCVPTRRR